MDATARRSSSRVHTFIALTVLACISFIILFSGDARQPAGVVHSRRAVSPPRNESISSISITQTTSDGVSSATSSSVSSASISATPILSSTDSITSVRQTFTTTTTTTSSLSTITSVTSVNSDRDTTTSTQPSIKATSSDLSTIPSTHSRTLKPTSSIFSTPTTSVVEPTKPVTSTTSSPITSASLDLQPVPVTTLVATNMFLPTSTSATIESITVSDSVSTSSVLSTPTPVSAASKASGMWQNKGVVAAIFVIVSLVFLAIGAFAVISFLKRRNKRRQEQLHDELFEKYSENDHRSNSPGPSINAAPMDAFASREIGFSQSDPFHCSPVLETFRINQTSTPVQHPDYYNTTTPARYISPSESIAAAQTTAPPTAFRNPAGRAPVARDSYQQSIDSFYGAAGQIHPSGYAV